MEVFHLRCEYLEHPLGIDQVHPKMSWKLKSVQRGSYQTAYQIQCALTFKFDDLIWDSGKIESDRSIHIEYAGRDLKSYERVYWRVKVWNEKAKPSEWSETAWWEMGMLNETDWQAQWIDPEGEIDPSEIQPAPFLRKEFNIRTSISSVRLYITAHGGYEAWINGERVGDQYFTPGRTSYDRCLQYQVYDVTDMIKEGNNVLGVILSDGWWRGSIGFSSKRNKYGERLAFLAQLEIKCNDSPKITIISDESWKCTSNGPILQSDLKRGDIYDSRKEFKDWNKVGFDDSEWHTAKVVDFSLNDLIASMGLPVREKERFNPLKVITTPKGEVVLDFGQNIAGYVEVQLNSSLPKDMTLSLTHGEALDQGGNFTLEHPRLGGYQKDIYIHDGTPRTYKPLFSVKGFRYVKVEGYPDDLDPKNFTAIVVYSDMKQTGDFHCSNELLNQLVKNTRWSQKGNFLDIPTDCPTRERSGWTGDAQIFSFAGSLLMNTFPFLKKWLKDVALNQKPSGRILNIIPYERMPGFVEGS
ncbi:MAG: family 78 glycoside hydrolase catalytic domain, partial [Candidatus Hodarchaeota archaeon]